MADLPSPWGTEGPVQAEVFVVRMRRGQLELTGPCGAAAWYIESHDEDDPMEVVKRLSTNLMGPPLLVHSTSWRRGPGGVILSFLVVVGEDQATELDSVPIGRTELARNSATDAATSVAASQVVEHALRHVAWLAQDDQAVRAALSPAWLTALAGYVPEPFRHLGRG
ncbi:MAG TPA: hypothetical protein VK256_14255 [Candidatus Eisenbacteria bacterium]|nr:hypothetical protein [Candidatus Eisenbacteria bacterium]